MADFLKSLEALTARVDKGEIEGATRQDVQEIGEMLAIWQIPGVLQNSKRSLLGGGVDTGAAKKFMADVRRVTGAPEMGGQNELNNQPQSAQMPNTPAMSNTENVGTQLQAASELPSSSPFTLGGSE